MFEGGDGEEEEKALPSSASSWFLALLLALIRYANNHVTAKVSDYSDWMEMTGSIWPTCGLKSHAGLEYAHTHTHSLPLSLILTHIHSPNFPLRIICHWTAILDLLSVSRRLTHSAHPLRWERRPKLSDQWKVKRSLIMRGKWKSVQEWLILTDRGRSKRRITLRNKRRITKTLQRRRKNHCTHK